MGYRENFRWHQDERAMVISLILNPYNILWDQGRDWYILLVFLHPEPLSRFALSSHLHLVSIQVQPMSPPQLSECRLRDNSKRSVVWPPHPLIHKSGYLFPASRCNNLWGSLHIFLRKLHQAQAEHNYSNRYWGNRQSHLAQKAQ